MKWTRGLQAKKNLGLSTVSKAVTMPLTSISRAPMSS